MMYATTAAKKLCSGRSENSHVTGTEQGDESCWQTLRDHFEPDDKRWLINTPVIRNWIPGLINEGALPTASWLPRVTFQNFDHANLCLPLTFSPVKPDGTPNTLRNVTVYTTYGDILFQGKTHKDTGKITVTGLHAGDRVNNFKVELFDCEPTARNSSPRINPARFLMVGPSAPSPAAREIKVVEPAPAFHVLTEITPSLYTEQAELIIRVEAPSGEALSLDKRPIVKIHSRAHGPAFTIPLSYSGSRKAYVGKLQGLPMEAALDVEVIATDKQGRSETTLGRFNISRIDPAFAGEFRSIDGQISLSVPPGTLATGTGISIGSAAVMPPNLPGGYEVVSGPYSILPPAGELSLCSAAWLRFQLPQQNEVSAMLGYVPESFKVLRHNPHTRQWDEIGGIVHPYPIDKVTVQTDRLGTFVLIARRDVQRQR